MTIKISKKTKKTIKKSLDNLKKNKVSVPIELPVNWGKVLPLDTSFSVGNPQEQQSVVDQVIKDYRGTLQALADRDNNLFLRCSCGSETLHLEYDKPYGLDICIFKLACESSKLSWKARLRWIWHILKTGNQYSDQIILSEENKEKLKEFLNRI